MTGTEFQRKFCEKLWNVGYWALDIPRDKRGAQPFDVVAMRADKVFAIDCKVCSGSPRFPLSRIEDNQWTAFATMKERTTATVGIAVYYSGSVYFVSYDMLLASQQRGDKSIPILEDGFFWFAIREDW